MAKRKIRAKRSAKRPPVRRLLAYPAVLFVLLCVGVLLTIWTFKALADSVLISAVVEAPPVTGAAVITSPADGQHFTSVPITVAGTCPSDGSGGYVKVYRNNVFSGAAICDSSNQFTLDTDLFAGANTISVQIYNVTDEPGPASTPVTVYYDVPATPGNSNPPTNSSSSGSGGSSTVPSAAPLVVSSQFRYQGYYVNQIVSWDLTITGGSPPYAINVDFGDGSSTVISRSSAGDFTVQHKYKKPGTMKNHTYTISVSAADSASDQSSLQLFVLINSPNVNPAAASIIGATCDTKGWDYNSLTCYIRTHGILKFLWPAYGILMLMGLSYWLGEREELVILTRKRPLTKAKR